MSDMKTKPDISVPVISILCVEDEPITRQFLSTIISMKFPEQNVFTADNGQEGLRIFREIDPDVVLTDISMPVMDGIRMAREIRQDKPEACIIALSAHNSFDCQPEEQEALFTLSLRKPISGELLCNAIDQCIAGIERTL